MADSLYADCIERGIKTANHASDLYIPATDETRELIRKHGHRATMFTNEVEGGIWYDVPFAFVPFWEARQRAGV
jgi:hypothetical protein